MPAILHFIEEAFENRRKQHLLDAAIRRINEKFGRPADLEDEISLSELARYLVDEGFEGRIAAAALLRWMG